MINNERIKNYVLSKKIYILDFYDKNWKTPESDKKLMKEFFVHFFWKYIEEYNEKTQEFTKYMLEREVERTNIEHKKIWDTKPFEDVLKKLNKHLELLEQENIYLEESSSDINSYKKILSNFKDRFNKNTENLEGFINKINEYENTIKNEIKEELEKTKNNIKLFFEKEKEKITLFLEKKSKKIIEEKFRIEKLTLDEEKRENFHFDLSIFIKYILLFWWALIICFIDFYLVQDIVIEEFDIDFKRDDESKKILYTIIIPLVPSFLLIFGEFLFNKNLKYIKFLKWLIHIVSFVSIILIIALVFVTFDIAASYFFRFIENPSLFDLLVRILLFWMAIPLTVMLLVKFFDWNEFIDFLKHLILPFIFLFLALKYYFEYMVLKKRKDDFLKDEFTFHLSLKDLKLFNEKEKQLDKVYHISDVFVNDLDDIWEKIEKAYSNISNLYTFLSKDQIGRETNIRWTLDWKIERLKRDIL